MDTADLVVNLKGLQINSLDDFDDVELVIRTALHAKLASLKPPIVKLKATVFNAAKAHVEARLAKYKNDAKPKTLQVHYYEIMQEYIATFGQFYRCPGSCSPTSPQDVTVPCPNYQRINWAIENGCPFSPFIFDHWYKQEDIAKSIDHAVNVLAHRIVTTLDYEGDFEDVVDYWGGNVCIVVHMGTWCDESNSHDARRKSIVSIIKQTYNKIGLKKLKLWMTTAPAPTPDYNEPPSQITERVFNLLHSNTNVNMSLYIQDKFGMTGNNKNIVLRCPNCDTAGKTNHPEYDKSRYVVNYNVNFDDDDF